MSGGAAILKPPQPEPAAPGVDLPAVTVGWDSVTQGVHLDFDPAEFRSWNFVIAILKMAVGAAEHQQKVSMLAQAQKNQMEAMANAAIRKAAGV